MRNEEQSSASFAKQTRSITKQTQLNKDFLSMSVINQKNNTNEALAPLQQKY